MSRFKVWLVTLREGYRSSLLLIRIACEPYGLVCLWKCSCCDSSKQQLLRRTRETILPAVPYVSQMGILAQAVRYVAQPRVTPDSDIIHVSFVPSSPSLQPLLDRPLSLYFFEGGACFIVHGSGLEILYQAKAVDSCRTDAPRSGYGQRY